MRKALAVALLAVVTQASYIYAAPIITQEEWESQRLPPFSYRVVWLEVTAYAPLDEGAQEGVCYSGDPTVTASGARVVPGVTVAAGPSYRFGTQVWIDGYGWRVVQDRGDKVSDRHMDLAVASRSEAFRVGRQRNVLVIIKEEE